MTAYLVACAASAPALLVGLLVAAAWVVRQDTQIGRRDHLLDELAVEVEQLNAELDQALAVRPGRTCTELGQCATRLTSDHRSVR